MNWRVEFAPEVELDIAAAADWYESRQPGLGVQFVEKSSACGMRWKKTLCSTVVGTRQRTSAGVILIVFRIGLFMKSTRPDEL
jgi:hypothetical protein